MKRLIPIVIVAALAVGVFALRPAADKTEEAAAPVETTLPRLVDLGADKCIPCKEMAPILDALKVEFAETFAVEFIDVWKNTAAAEEYGVKVIPTQIFYDADGVELFRHEGFFSRRAILSKWRELGLDIPPDPEDA